MRIEKIWRITTPEEAEQQDKEYYESLTPQQKLDMIFELRDAWTTPDQRRLKRTYQYIELPPD